MSASIYLLHFDRPYKHARHYLGFTERPVEERLLEHGTGKGARLLQVVRAAGITWQLARVWPNATRGLERQLKNGRRGPRLCPICRHGDHLGLEHVSGIVGRVMQELEAAS